MHIPFFPAFSAAGHNLDDLASFSFRQELDGSVITVAAGAYMLPPTLTVLEFTGFQDRRQRSAA